MAVVVVQYVIAQAAVEDVVGTSQPIQGVVAGIAGVVGVGVVVTCSARDVVVDKWGDGA